MSKITEQKALEAYPPHYQKLAGDGYFDMSLEKREGYIRGYDQALQDLLEKAEEFFDEELYVSVSDQICSVDEFSTMKDFVKRFKNYMRNESEN